MMHNICLFIAHLLVMTAREHKMFPGNTVDMVRNHKSRLSGHYCNYFQNICRIVGLAMQAFFTASYVFAMFLGIQCIFIYGHFKPAGWVVGMFSYNWFAARNTTPFLF